MFLLDADIFPWDLTILLLLSFFASIVIAARATIRRDDASTTRNILVGLVGILGLLGFLTIVYGSFIEPRIIVTTRVSVTHPLGNPIRIAVISDLHTGPYKGKGFVERVVSAVNATLPDLILMPGDFIMGSSSRLSDLDPLKRLRAPMGVFAVLGNHETGETEDMFGNRYAEKYRGDEIAQKLAEDNVRVLRNDNDVIPMTEGVLAVAGIDDLWSGKSDIKKALAGIPAGAFIVLLSHNPSVIDDPLSRPAHLVVSGHTHGGQIRLPWIGAFVDLHTTIGPQYDEGLFQLEGGRNLVITRGIGESSPRARILAWPQILIINVQSKS